MHRVMIVRFKGNYTIQDLQTGLYLDETTSELSGTIDFMFVKQFFTENEAAEFAGKKGWIVFSQQAL